MTSLLPSSRRGRLIAGQAAIVAVLIAIAYAAFLAGDDPGTLTGIDAPGDTQVTVDGKGNGKGEGTGRDSVSRRNQASGGTGSGGGGAGTAGATRPGAPAGDAFASAPTPADNQYSDTLAALERELGMTGTTPGGPSKRRGTTAARSR